MLIFIKYSSFNEKFKLYWVCMWINSKALEGRDFFEKFPVVLMELRNAFCIWVHCMLWSRPTSYLWLLSHWNESTFETVLFPNTAPQEGFLSRIYTFIAASFSTQKTECPFLNYFQDKNCCLLFEKFCVYFFSISSLLSTNLKMCCL